MLVSFLVAFGLDVSGLRAPVEQVDFTPPITDVAIFGPDSRILVRSGLPLPADNQIVYETDFLGDDAYFGAFAISKDGAYGYVTGSNSIEAARNIALGECERYAPYCIIHTELYPVGYDMAGETRATFSRDVLAVYNSLSTRPRNYALAISQDGAYSLSFGYGTQAEADRRALDDCESYRITDIATLPDYPCVLIPLP